MADISDPIKYPLEMVALIEQKLAEKEFNHLCWSGDDFELVRSYIRGHYRRVQKGYCAYCKNELSLQAAGNCHVEHIAPKSKYVAFMFVPENLCAICADCNEIKRNQETICEVPDTVVNGGKRKMYPRSSSAFYIVHPHFDNYSDHIVIVRGFYLDKTKKGHFTIGACNLNRRLREFGWEPQTYCDDEVSGLMNDYLAAPDPAAKRLKINALRDLLVMS